VGRCRKAKLMLNQTYQMVGRNTEVRQWCRSITTAKLNGDSNHFNAGGTEYSGRVVGNTIEGGSWKATRISK